MPDARLSVGDRLGYRVARLDTFPFTIGRGPDNALNLLGNEVSRDHAQIVRDGEHYVLRDRQSRYGTFINGAAVTEQVLRDGDRIRLGRSSAVELIFLEGEEEPLTREALVGALRQTAALLEGLRALGAVHLLNDVLVLVLDAAVELSGADRGFIMLAGPGGQLEFRVGRDRDHVTLEGGSFLTSRKIPEAVFATGESRLISDLVEERAGTDHAATMALGIRQVLCVPLRLRQYLDRPGAAPEPARIGVLYLDGRASGALLSATTQLGVETLATEASVAIENARLYRESVEKARLDQELRIAADMQRALRPQSGYVRADVEVVGASESSRSIGGDFFDYIGLADGAVGVAIGDVAGKGPPAAVLAAALQGMFAAHAAAGLGPGEMLARSNVALARHFIENRFATMVYLVFRPGGWITYSTAGHNPPMLFSGERVRRLECGGVPLGLFPDAEFREETFQLAVDDVIVMFSDGVSEAESPAGEPFGDERIVSTIAPRLHTPPSALLGELLGAVRAFNGGQVPQDDMTALVLRYTG